MPWVGTMVTVQGHASFFLREEFLAMRKKDDGNMRKNKRKRRRRRAGGVLASVIFCAAVFTGGFFTGYLGQLNWEERTLAEHTVMDTGNVWSSQEEVVCYDMYGNIMEDAGEGEEGSPEYNADEEGYEDKTQTGDIDGEWNLVLVNKWNAIPDGCEVNLVDVDGGEQVDERIYEPLMEMLEDAREANWDQLPLVVSGYRTEKRQQKIFDDKKAEYRRQGYSDNEAEEMAQQWAALPGYSEHQLGLAVDINGATYDLYFWLQENSYKYGFIFRYPGHKTELTGVAEEVWHYRYVGVEAATEIYEQGICLEEYLENRAALF